MSKRNAIRGEGKCGRISRREALQVLAGTGAAAWSTPSLLASGRCDQSSQAATSSSQAPVRNPAWFGFNLLEYFSTDPDWMKYFPYKDDGMFLEDDFRWIRDWGFNWVRLPMDYRFWTDPNDLMKIDERKVEPIDRAVKLGEKYNLHVNICLHRAPGYCILDTLNEKLTGIRITKEKTDLFTDQKTLDAFLRQWTFFASRYQGISSDHLSFNLMNEPLLFSPPKGAQNFSGYDWRSYFSDPDWLACEKKYARVALAAIDAIRAVDSDRLIITDGLLGANLPIPLLVDTGVTQSAHTYTPALLTHYRCEWARGIVPLDSPLPSWPLKDAQGEIVCDRSILNQKFSAWKIELRQGVPIHFGEMGCYKYTPPQIVYRWFDDSLAAIRALGSGWALWNFRGPFGVLDTERAGTKFEDWYGHHLDRALLELLQAKMKSS
jgi:endoglucanase